MNNKLIINEKDNISNLNFEIPLSSNGIINDNEWYINNANEIIVKCNGKKFGSYFRYIPDLIYGDQIIVSGEIMCLEGVFPKIAIDNNKNYNLILEKLETSNMNYNQWIPIDLDYTVISKEEFHKIVIGTFTNEISYFKLRNFTVEIFTRGIFSFIKEKELVIHTSNNIFSIIENISSVKGNFLKVNDYSMSLSFNQPFSGKNKITFQTTNDIGNTIELGLTSVNNNSMILRAKEIQTGKLIKIDDLKNNNIIYVNLKQLN